MFVLTLHTDNAAFADNALEGEVSRILLRVAQEIAVHPDAYLGDGKGLYDINGNRVGSAQLNPNA